MPNEITRPCRFGGMGRQTAGGPPPSNSSRPVAQAGDRTRTDRAGQETGDLIDLLISRPAASAARSPRDAQRPSLLSGGAVAAAGNQPVAPKTIPSPTSSSRPSPTAGSVTVAAGPTGAEGSASQATIIVAMPGLASPAAIPPIHTAARISPNSIGGGPLQMHIEIQGDAYTGPDQYHPGTSVPNVMQGMLWAGNPVVVDQNEVVHPEYTAVNFTWTYPTGAVKGYGIFKQFQERPGAADPGNYWLFTGPPTDTGDATPGGSIAMSDHEPIDANLKYTADDLSYQSNLAANGQNAEVNDHVINQFYWGPDAVGQQTVTVNATFINTQAPFDKVTGGDTVTVNVIRPTGSIYNVKQGQAGVSATDGFKNQYLSLDKTTPRDISGNAIGLPVGIEWNATVDTPTVKAPDGTNQAVKDPYGTAYTGSFVMTQVVVYNAQRTYTDTQGVVHTQWSGRLPGGTSPNPATTVDDMRYDGLVEPHNNPQLGQEVFNVGLPAAYANDSPATLLTFVGWNTPEAISAATWWRTDNFSLVLMYNPNPNPDAPVGPGKPYPGRATIWVPVGYIPWSWSAFANLSIAGPTSGTWVQGTGAGAPKQSFGTYAASTEYPIWQHQVKEVDVYQ